nr:fimbria/pilus outer membrane usher protein [uncultured Deefgea sp.]
MQALNASLFFFALQCAVAAEPLLLALTLNGVPQGDVAALYEQDQYWVATKALQGFDIDTAKTIFFEGERYVLISSLKDLQSKFNENEMTLNLTAAAQHFGEHEIVLKQDPSQLYSAPAPFSWYLNYQLSLLKQSQTDGLGFQFNPSININQGYFNLRSEHSYAQQNQQSEWRRISTTLEYDMPEAMMRLSFGDLVPASGPLGQSLAMAGVGVARVFAMQPNFSASPAFQLQTAVTQTSTADIFLNGQQIASQTLPPGVYNFNDLRYYTGLQNVEIVIRDSSGNTRGYQTPYYFDDSLLKAGLSEFNYNVGLARKNGSFDQYEGLAYAGYQRFGVSDWLTLGAQASGQSDSHRAGLFANIKLGNYGTLGSAFSWAKHKDQNSGSAQELQYRFVDQNLSVTANARRQEENFRQKNPLFPELSAPDWFANLGVSWGQSSLGNVSLNLGRQMGASEEQTFTLYQLGYSFSPSNKVSINTQLQYQQHTSKSQLRGFLNLSWNFDQGRSLYASSRYQDGKTYSGTTFNQSAPSGEGWGYSAGVQQQEESTDYTAWLQNKQAHGQIDLSLLHSDQANRSANNAQLSWSGALAYTDGHYALTRPITQSFAIVELPNTPDVSILQNGNPVGKTDASGRVFIPDLANNSWHQISLTQEEIPLNYRLPELRQDLLTGYHDGQIVSFTAQSISAVSGRLLDQNGQALANRNIQIETNSSTLELQTTLDGDFYTEDLTPGQYTFRSDSCTGLITVPSSTEIVNEIPTSFCKE